MITIKKGDLLATKGIITHGVNCVGGFGSGIAGQIAREFPYVREFYLTKHKSEGWKLGDIQVVTISPDKLFVNCATQFNFLPRDIVHADYTAIATCMHKLKLLSTAAELEINLPKIGCGLAGGDWNEVKKIIDNVFEYHPINVKIWEL